MYGSDIKRFFCNLENSKPCINYVAEKLCEFENNVNDEIKSILMELQEV